MTRKNFQQFLTYGFLALTPLFLWVFPSPKGASAVFGLMGIFHMVSRYHSGFRPYHEVLETSFLLILSMYLTRRLDISRWYPLDVVLILVLMILFFSVVRKIPRAKLHLTTGSPGRGIGFAIPYAVLSLGGLYFWFLSHDGNPYVARVPDWDTHILIFMGIGFAAVNALYEEGIFRCVLLSVFRNAFGLPAGNIMQALWFAALHYRNGFPSGAAGIALTFIFGLMTAHLVDRTRGVLLAFLVHFVADMMVFGLILLRMHHLV